MMERIEQLIAEKLAVERRQILLQIDALQAQINPHFLHNTLENIIYLIENGEREAVVDMIGLLSRLFRYAAGKENPMTTLREEISYVETYMKIMNFRFKDKIERIWTRMKRPWAVR